MCAAAGFEAGALHKAVSSLPHFILLLLQKLWQMDTFWFSLPPHRRHTRWLPGFHPRLTHNPSLGQKVW